MDRRHNFLEKCTNLKPAILLYQRSLKCRNFRELDKDTIALLSYQVDKVFCCTKDLHMMKNQERYWYYTSHFMLIITLMLLRIVSEALTSMSNTHNYKTFTKSPPASLLDYIENILNHSCGKCCRSLKIAVLSLKSQLALICTIFIHLYQHNYQLEKRDNTDTSHSFLSRRCGLYSKRLCLFDNHESNSVSFKLTNILPSSEF